MRGTPTRSDGVDGHENGAAGEIEKVEVGKVVAVLRRVEGLEAEGVGEEVGKGRLWDLVGLVLRSLHKQDRGVVLFPWRPRRVRKCTQRSERERGGRTVRARAATRQPRRTARTGRRRGMAVA